MSKTLRRSDRRGFGRRWSCVRGWICVDGRPRISCVIKNFSEEGALLQVDSPASLPFQFRLKIDTIGFEIGCQVKHVHDFAVGVTFASTTVVQKDGSLQSVDDLLHATTISMGADVHQASVCGQ